MQTIGEQPMTQNEGTKLGGFAAGFFGSLVGALLVQLLAKSAVTRKFGWIGFVVSFAFFLLLLVLAALLALVVRGADDGTALGPFL